MFESFYNAFGATSNDLGSERDLRSLDARASGENLTKLSKHFPTLI